MEAAGGAAGPLVRVGFLEPLAEADALALPKEERATIIQGGHGGKIASLRDGGAPIEEAGDGAAEEEEEEEEGVEAEEDPPPVQAPAGAEVPREVVSEYLERLAQGEGPAPAPASPSGAEANPGGPAPITPYDHFKAAAKKVLWRIRQRSKAMMLIRRGHKYGGGTDAVLRSFGSSGAVMQLRKASMKSVLDVYAREIAYHRGTVLSEAPELWAYHPRLHKREKILTDAYFTCVLERYTRAWEERRNSAVLRVVTDLAKTGGRTLAVGLWQFCSGPDFHARFIFARHKLLHDLLEMARFDDLSIGAIWALCERSPDVREFLVHEMHAVPRLVQHAICTPSLAGVLCSFSCIDMGVSQLSSEPSLRRLFGLLGAEAIPQASKLLVAQALASLWPRSTQGLVALCRSEAPADLEATSSAIDALVCLATDVGLSEDGGAEALLRATTSVCVLTQLGQACTDHVAFTHVRVLELFLAMGRSGCLALSQVAKGRPHRGYFDVLLQACCCGIAFWVNGTWFQQPPQEAQRLSKDILRFLRNVFATREPGNHIKAVGALLELFEQQQPEPTPEVCELVLSRLRLCHRTPEITRNILIRAFNTAETCETMNRSGALAVVLNMMRHYIHEKETLFLASKAALLLALAPNVHSFSASLLLSLLQSSSGDARNALLCVLYGITAGEGPFASEIIADLAADKAKYDTVLRVMSNVSMDFYKPFFELVALVVWRASKRFDRPENELEDVSNTMVAHLVGNCSHLRKTVQRYKDYSAEARMSRGTLLNVNYCKEVQMWEAVSYKRSLLETSKATPQALRGASTIIGFYETQREAVEAFVAFETCKEQARNRFLAPLRRTSTLFTAPGDPFASSQAAGAPDPEDAGHGLGPFQLKRVSLAVLSRVRILLGILADMFRISQDKLRAKHDEELQALRDELEAQRDKRAVQQEKDETSLELDEIPASRARFRKMERLQRQTDKAKLVDLLSRQHTEETCIFAILFSKEVAAELFFVGFSHRFEKHTKQIAAWLLWELLFERQYVEQTRISSMELDLFHDLLDHEDRDHGSENREHREGHGDGTSGDEDEDEDEDEEDEDEEDDDDDDDDLEGDGRGGARGGGSLSIPEPPKSPTSRRQQHHRERMASKREEWNRRKLLFGRPRTFFDMRFAALLTVLGGSDDAELELCAARLFMRLAMLYNDTSVQGCSCIAKVGGIDVLLKLLKSKCAETQHCAAMALRKLAGSQIHQELMSANGGFNTLLRMAMDDAHVDAKTLQLLREIMVPLRRHPCNGTQLYQAEIRGVPPELIKRPLKKASFSPAVQDITISSTPRTRGAYKVQLAPLLFAESYSGKQFVPRTNSNNNARAGALLQDAPAEAGELVAQEDDEALQAAGQERDSDAETKNGELALGGPMFVFFPTDPQAGIASKKMKGAKRGRANKVPPVNSSISFDRYLDEDPKQRDEFWDKTLSKFDRCSSHVLPNMPTYEAPDGHQFHLFLRAAEPQQPVEPQRARIFDTALRGLLDPLQIEDVCNMRNFQQLPGETLSALLLRFSRITTPDAQGGGDRVEAPDAEPDELITTSIRSSKMRYRVGLPTTCIKCHPLLGHLGRKLGHVFEENEDFLQLFFYDPPPRRSAGGEDDIVPRRSRASTLFQAAASGTNSEAGREVALESSAAQLALIQIFGSEDKGTLWESKRQDEMCVSNDWELVNLKFLSQDQREQTLRVLSRHASLVIALFRFYSVDQAHDHSHENAFEAHNMIMLRLGRFFKLVCDCGLLRGANSKLLRERMELAFLATLGTSPQRDPKHPLNQAFEKNHCISFNKHLHALTRFEFLACLCRVAVVCYPAVPTSEALETLFQDDLVPAFAAEPLLDPNVFRINVFNTPEVFDVLYERADALHREFEAFAGSHPKSRDWGGLRQTRMALPDWIALWDSIPLLTVPHQVCVKAFALSLHNEPRLLDRWEAAVCLDFARYTQAVGRVAAMLFLPEQEHLDLVGADSVPEFFEFLADSRFFHEADGAELGRFLGSDQLSLLSFDRPPELPTEEHELSDKLVALIEMVEYKHTRVRAVSPPVKKRKKKRQAAPRYGNLPMLQEAGALVVKPLAQRVAHSHEAHAAPRLADVVRAQRIYSQLRAWVLQAGPDMALGQLDDFLEAVPEADHDFYHVAAELAAEMLLASTRDT